MSSLSIDDVKKLAVMSALELDATEVTSLQKELAEILGYVEQLQAVDTEGVEPTYQVNHLKNVTRADTIIDYGLSREALLEPAAEARAGQIVVPRVVE